MNRAGGDRTGLAVHHHEEDHDGGGELFEASSCVSGGDEDQFPGSGAEGAGGDKENRRLAPQPLRRLNSDSIYDMSSMTAQLPAKKGLSRYYEGKAQSFACMSEVRSLEDLRKKEKPRSQKIKPCQSYAALGGMAKKPAASSCANLSMMAGNGLRAPLRFP